MKGTTSIEIKSNVKHPGSAFYGLSKGHGFFYNPFLEEIVSFKNNSIDLDIYLSTF